ncbi:hypothetical protein BDA96_01G153900 [Sorghum bicolor]|uniref:Uncharacterized protein n=2 Tax=Sorghum bicolor TaxID=4558 RepID=A0A921RYN9_SORBI|nr:hypothetical protein BDA96_01G153900 [Sorghum bicolor]KXG37891.1 hypothetical protein SORBI_3001G146600 [Sorghum bicolor]
MSDTLHSAVPPPSARHSSGFHGHRRRRRAAAGAGTRSGPGLPARVAPRVRPPRDDAAPGVRAGRGPLQSSASTSSPSSSSCRAAAASVRSVSTRSSARESVRLRRRRVLAAGSFRFTCTRSSQNFLRMIWRSSKVVF